MNKENVLALADLIEKLPAAKGEDTGFSMEEYQHSCGAPACIAGWAAYTADPKTKHRFVGSVAMKHLDLSPDEASELFMMANTTLPLGFVTPHHAARVLRLFAATGKIDWDTTYYD